MNSLQRYLLVVTCLVLLSGCRKTLDTRTTLWHLDKIPYGTRYTHENLKSVFPKADIKTNGRLYPDMVSKRGEDDSLRALLVVGRRFQPDENELEDVLHFAASGNQVFISAEYLGGDLQNKLGINVSYMEVSDSITRLYDANGRRWLTYRYPGKFHEYYFDSLDSRYVRVLGKNNLGKPNFVRVGFEGGGAIFVHLEPLAFGNFFLLHQGNKTYFDIALSNLPENVDVVEWSDYFRYSRQGERFSPWKFLFSNRALRWAFWLSLLLFAILIIVESKRKQRPIAVIPPPRNASEDFVKTVGRLYFQQKNNQNLAAKMSAAYLENIRSQYNIQTSVTDETFIRTLSFRTGRPFQEVEKVIRYMEASRSNPALSDQALMELHHLIVQITKPA